MSHRRQLLGRAVAVLAIALGLSSTAYALTAFGAPKRVDQDAGASAVYGFGNFYVIHTGAGGFAIAWEENTRSENPIVYERVLYRVFNNAFAPVAVPRAANIASRRVPTLARIVPLGAANAYLVYAVTRSNANPDHPELREAFGQTIALSTGAAVGARQLLNSSGNWDTLITLAAGLSDGRAVTGWYETDAFAPAPGRFISKTGVLQPIALNFACCTDQAQLTGLFPLGTAFVASYFRNSIFGGHNGLYGRVFKADGQPVGAAKYITASTLNPFIRTLSNGRIAVFSFAVIGGGHYKFVVQAYAQNWAKLGAAKTLIADTATTKYLDVATTLDGGVLLVRTLLNGTAYTRSVRRLDATFTPVGTDYTFASSGFDFFRAAAVSNTRAVVLFRNIVNSRQRLLAQVLSY